MEGDKTNTQPGVYLFARPHHTIHHAQVWYGGRGMGPWARDTVHQYTLSISLSHRVQGRGNLSSLPTATTPPSHSLSRSTTSLSQGVQGPTLTPPLHLSPHSLVPSLTHSLHSTPVCTGISRGAMSIWGDSCHSLEASPAQHPAGPPHGRG